MTSFHGKQESKPPHLTKKQRIKDLFQSGTKDVLRIARIVGTSSSYVASVLQNEGWLQGYFDLYTSGSQPMNIYSQLFSQKLGYKDEKTARQSVRWINRAYRRFVDTGDFAGQHHAMAAALSMFNRARSIHKWKEASIYQAWLVQQLSTSLEPIDPITSPNPQSH